TILLARRLPVVVGFLRGYMSVSFAAEARVLWERGERTRCLGHMAGNVGAGVVAAGLGTALVRGLVEAAGRRPARDGRSAAIAAPESEWLVLGKIGSRAMSRDKASSRTGSPRRAVRTPVPVAPDGSLRGCWLRASAAAGSAVATVGRAAVMAADRV